MLNVDMGVDMDMDVEVAVDVEVVVDRVGVVILVLMDMSSHVVVSGT